MKNKKGLILILLIAFFATPTSAQINVKRTGKRIEMDAKQKARQQANKEQSKTSNNKSLSNEHSSSNKVWYVSKANGNNRNEGTQTAPFKNIQKAINVASDGETIMVAQGNYFGLMDIGYIDLNKSLTIKGGYSADFSERDLVKYATMIQPSPASTGTSGSKATIELTYPNGGVACIDGIIFDKGPSNGYSGNEGKPDGVETGLLLPVGGKGPKGEMTSWNPFIKGVVKGTLTIRNCVFVNAPNYALQIGISEGKVLVKNNLFVNCCMAMAEIRGASNRGDQAEVEYAYNTMLFGWARTKGISGTDMGYGIRCMTRANTLIHHNIIGLCFLAGIDRTRIDSDAKMEAARKIDINDNVFFMNRQADMTLPSGGGLYLQIFHDSFDDVESITGSSGNAELKSVEGLKSAIFKPYLEGFMNLAYSEKSDYDPNSQANRFRSAMGMNQVATIKSNTSMFANSYPLNEALKLVGIMKDRGMQKRLNEE